MNLHPLSLAFGISTAASLAPILTMPFISRSPAATKHLVWLLAFVAMAVCGTVALSGVVLKIPMLPPVSDVAKSGETPGTAVVAIPANAFGLKVTDRAIAISTAHSFFLYDLWAVGILLQAIVLSIGVMRLKQICARSQAITAGFVYDVYLELCKRSGLARPAALLASTEIKIPMVAKLLRPCVILPDAASQWPRETLEVVLSHEIAHLKRHDLVTLAFARFVSCVYWFNPLAWYCLRGMRRETEMAADDHVISTGFRPVLYAENLVAIIRGLRDERRFSAIQGLGVVSKRDVTARLGRILDGSLRRSVPSRRLRAVLLAGTAFIAAGMVAIRPVAAGQPSAGDSTGSKAGAVGKASSITHGTNEVLIAKVNGEKIYSDPSVNLSKDEVINHALVIQEVKRQKLTLPAGVEDGHINDIIRIQFHGNESAFEKHLASGGYTLARFREIEANKIFYAGMLNHYNGVHARDKSKPTFEDWVKFLRNAAKIEWP